MSLYDELASEVHALLGDPDVKTGSVIVRRELTQTADPDRPWIRPERTFMEIQLNAVVFSKEAEFSSGTLVVERGDEITCSTTAIVVREAGRATYREVPFEPHGSDVFLVDGDERRVVRVKRTPAAGTPVSWNIRVAD